MKPLSCTTNYLEFLTQSSKEVSHCTASSAQIRRTELSLSPIALTIYRAASILQQSPGPLLPQPAASRRAQPSNGPRLRSATAGPGACHGSPHALHAPVRLPGMQAACSHPAAEVPVPRVGRHVQQVCLRSPSLPASCRPILFPQSLHLAVSLQHGTLALVCTSNCCVLGTTGARPGDEPDI